MNHQALRSSFLHRLTKLFESLTFPPLSPTMCFSFLSSSSEGVITPNQIPLTTIVTYLQKCYRSRISNHWATIYPIYKRTVTYHFSDLKEVYSGNRYIHTKCQLQYLHPPPDINKWQMSLCNNSSDNKSY